MVTPTSRGASSSGGSAAASGESFRADVATEIAVHILAQSPLWTPSPIDATPCVVYCEAPFDVDDIQVETQIGRILLQAKGNHRLSIPKDAVELPRPLEDPFVKAIAQLIKQQNGPSPLNVTTDRFVLVYKSATEEIDRIKQLAERCAGADVSKDEAQGRAHVMRNDAERATFRRFERVVQAIVSAPAEWKDIVGLLRVSLFWELREGVTQRAALDQGNLMRFVLADGEPCHAAIELIGREILTLAANASGADIESLRRLLGRAHRLAAVPDCSRDIARIEETSKAFLDGIKRWQRPPFGKVLDRGHADALLAGLREGPTVVVGDRGYGKSAAALALVELLERAAARVLVCNLRQASESLFVKATDPPLTNRLDRVLAAFPGPWPAYFILDGLDEVATNRMLEKAVVALVETLAAAKDRWRLLALTRPLALRGKPELMAIFEGAPLSEVEPGFEDVRHLRIPRFTDGEVACVLANAPQEVRQQILGSPSLLRFVSEPAVLAMLSDIVEKGGAAAGYTAALIRGYWEVRVGGGAREATVIQLAKMLRARGLSAMPLTEVLAASGVSAEALESLRSDGVVVRTEGTLGLAYEMVIEYVHVRYPDA